MPGEIKSMIECLGWHRSPYLSVLLVSIWVSPVTVQAVDFQWDGFATLGIANLDDDSINQLENNFVPHNIFEEGTQADVDTRIGFQGIAAITDNFSATLQVVANDTQSDTLELEWAYLAYDFNPATKIRVGRLRRPFFYSSDILPVGYVYPWARPPLEVYSRDVSFSDNLDAIALLYRSSAGSWDLATEIYYGNSSVDVSIGPIEDAKFKTTHSSGIVLDLEKDWFNLRASYHRSPDVDADTSADFQLLIDNLDAAGFTDLSNELETRNKEAEFFNVAANIDYEDWLLGLELLYLPVEGFAPDEESWYLTGGRRFGPWTAHLTYGERSKEFDKIFSTPVSEAAAAFGTGPLPPALDEIRQGLLDLAAGVDQTQEGFKTEYRSVTLGLRYDFDRPISIKTELQRITDERNKLSNNLVSLVVDFLF